MHAWLRVLSAKGTQSTGAKHLLPDSQGTTHTGAANVTYYPNTHRSANEGQVALKQPTDEAELKSRTRDLIKKPTKELLRRLTVEFGMSWSGIAFAIGISVQSIRKWRQGASISNDNKMALAKVVAVLDILNEEQIEDPASWFELPILEGYSPRHLDLLPGKQYGPLLELAYSYREPQEVLHSINPNWEIEFRLEHEVFIAEDGLPAIRRRKPRGKP